MRPYKSRVYGMDGKKNNRKMLSVIYLPKEQSI